jgi:tRNA(His) guanylyltransferase
MSYSDMSIRMRGYEYAERRVLPKRLPVVIRIDGKAFHTFTRTCKKPWDENLEKCMNYTALDLCKEVQDCQIAYVKSNEISLFLHNYKTLQSEPWFGNVKSKIESISASMATGFFNAHADLFLDYAPTPAFFDSRAWILPESEVCNYFLERQFDATKNSIFMLANSLYSAKQLQGKKRHEMQEMCFQKGYNWNDLPTYRKRGRCIIKKDGIWVIDKEVPRFNEDRNYIEQYLQRED